MVSLSSDPGASSSTVITPPIYIYCTARTVHEEAVEIFTEGANIITKLSDRFCYTVCMFDILPPQYPMSSLIDR